MGRLSELNLQIARLNGTVPPEEVAESIDWGEYVEAITESIVDLSERLEKATQANKPLEAKDYSGQIDELTAAFGKASTALGQASSAFGKANDVLADRLVDAVKGIAIPAAVVNVPEIEIEQAGPMMFDIVRDRDGLIQRVVARPYEDDAPQGKTYEME